MSSRSICRILSNREFSSSAALNYVVGITSRYSRHCSTSSRRMASTAAAVTTNGSTSKKSRFAKRLEGTDENVWVVYGKLATDYTATNLGQGFPDYFPPKYVTDGLLNVATGSSPFVHQYTRSYGHPRLINILAKTFSPMLGREVKPMEEILVTVGAYGSLYCTVQGLVDPGDEAIIIEPFFDCYEPMVKKAGGTPKFVPLKPSGDGRSSADWKLDPSELEAAFSDKTKILFLNNPNNPLGKVYSRAELEMVAALAVKYDVIVIADEVYEWMVYPGHEHVKIASLPGMWDRTITIGSAGKTFSVTGWKLGWAVGPADLIRALSVVHQNCIYTCPTPIQEAVATGFELEFNRLGHDDCYFNGAKGSLAMELYPKRNRMAEILTEAGLTPCVPEGGYFMIADYTQLADGVDLSGEEGATRDAKFVKWMTKNKQLASIPQSAFYSKEHAHLAENFIRFCFIKQDETLEKAAEIFKAWRG